MERQKRQTETAPEEIREYLRKAEEKKHGDLLWSGDRTIKEAYSQISSIYSDLADTLGDFVSGLPEGGLDISGKYADTSLHSRIISEYYRQKSDKVSADGRLADRINTPGWETLRVLFDLPKDMLSEIKQDMQKRGDSPIYGTSISIIGEVGKIIKESLPSLPPEETDLTIFPEPPSMEEREDYIIQDRIAVLQALYTAKRLGMEIAEIREKVSPGLRKKFTEYTRTAEIIEDSVSRYRTARLLSDYLGNSQTIEEAQRRYTNSKDLLSALSDLMEEKDRYYKIQEIDGEIRVIEYKSDIAETEISPLETLIKEAREASLQYQKSGLIKVPKDLMETQIRKKSAGDMLLIGTDKLKKEIGELQKEGKLLAGTLEGLSGGTAYLKAFIIVLAKTLNEQSKYYDIEKDWEGIPKDILEERIGKEVYIERKRVEIKGEQRQYPYVLIIYEDIAKKMSKSGVISGGKDAEFIRQYIHGYTKQIINGKTGKIENVLVRGLKERQYIKDLGKTYGGVPILQNEMTIYAKGTGKELGCICRLSPQFSETVRGYAGLRSDTIQLLGGGKQKEITMDLIDMLIFNRGVVQKGRKRGEFGVLKDDILNKYRDTPNYKGRPGKLETDYREAIQKAKDSKIISKYKEEKNPGGIIRSVFSYNPDYLNGEESSLVDDQSGE